MAKNGNPINTEIKNWLEGERDFKKGIDLLEDNAPNMRTLIKHIRHKETPENVEHLAYQLFKLSGMTDESICYRPITETISLPDSTALQIPKVEKEIKETPAFEIGGNLAHDDINEFDFGPTNPDETAFYDDIIKYQKDCYNARAVTHKELVELGDLNTEDIISKRVALLHTIDNFTKIVDYIHLKKLEWKETGVKPDESILVWQPTEVIPEPEKPKVDVEVFSDLDLSGELAKVRSRLSKYPVKIAKYSGDKLADVQQKQAADEILKTELISKIEIQRSK